MSNQKPIAKNEAIPQVQQKLRLPKSFIFVTLLAGLVWALKV